MLLQLHITLEGLEKPPVWRKLLVPGSFTFHKLHLAIQAAFGWYNYHLYVFSAGGIDADFEIGDPALLDDESVVNSLTTKLSTTLKDVGDSIIYTYDFGDDWEHSITVEAIADIGARKAALLSGGGACPPEDCGGTWGYADLLKIMKNKKHKEHEAMREWLMLEDDKTWDAHAFDLQWAAKKVKAV